MRRKPISNALSVDVLEHVLKTYRLSQEQIAELAEVSASFISRVRSGERSFTTSHLKTLSDALDVPLGALLLAAVPKREVQPQYRRLQELCIEGIRLADELDAVIKARRKAEKESGVVSR